MGNMLWCGCRYEAATSLLFQIEETYSLNDSELVESLFIKYTDSCRSIMNTIP